MEPWLKISLILSIFGFLREAKPSYPFITDYLMDFKNITLDEILRDVYPIGTYSYMVQAVLAFLITDFLRYKPLIVVSGVTGIIVWSIFVWGKSLGWMQAAEVFYGTYLATEVAYYTYMYAKVDRQHYDKVTAHNRSAAFLGRFVGGVAGQLLILANLMNYKGLNYLTLCTQILCTVWVIILLPNVKSSIYFHRNTVNAEVPLSSVNANKSEVLEINLEGSNKSKNVAPTGAFTLLFYHFVSSYSDIEVVQWSLWYAIGNCGFVQITTYIQVLWDTIDSTQDIMWNGAVEATVTLLSAVVTLLAERIQQKLLRNSSGLWTLTILTALEGVAIVLGTKTNSLFVSYLGYTIFCTLFAFTITICSACLAKKLEEDSFGLIFGINTFIALIMQSILTFTVVSKNVVTLDVVSQFLVYAGFYFVFALLYLCNILANYFFIKK